jgi:hypothetical protein
MSLPRSFQPYHFGTILFGETVSLNAKCLPFPPIVVKSKYGIREEDLQGKEEQR